MLRRQSFKIEFESSLEIDEYLVVDADPERLDRDFLGLGPRTRAEPFGLDHRRVAGKRKS